MESGGTSREGYFGYANRGGAPDETYGIVPGSKVDIFDKDQVADTFSVGVSYDLTPGVTLYGLISTGITPNTALADGAGEAIPAEETLNHEIGIKFDLMDGKLSGNLTAFKIRRENGIWYVGAAPNPSSWADARLSPKRASNWSLPTYDPEVPTTYHIDAVHLVDYLSELFGIKREYLDFAAGNQIVQEIWNIPEDDWKAFDWTPPSGLSILERLNLRKDVTSKTQFPEGFAHDVTSGGASNMSILLDASGLDKLSEITLFDPETGTYITKPTSNLSAMYLAFLGYRAQESGIRYSAWSIDGQPPENNNVDNTNGASVTFDEDIQGGELEIFYSPTDNLQFVLGYTHIERKAVNSFDFVEWESIAGTEGTFIPPFAQLHLYYGWENAGIDLAWVDYGVYESALNASSDGIVAIDTLPESALERLPDGEADTAISAAEFASRNEGGQILLLIDKRGSVINEANSARARDFHNILSGVSLNYNPEDEVSLFGKYTFSEGILERLSLTAGFKVTGPSRTSMEFNSVYLFDGLRHTPNVSERFQMDLGASYRWRWRGIDMRLSINVYNVTNDTYSVTTQTLDISNPVTGESITKRTEKFYAPTTFRVGLSMAF
jgi:hypothetical protein